MPHPNFFVTVYDCLMEPQLDLKLEKLSRLQSLGLEGARLEPTDTVVRVPDAGRPAKPELVSPKGLSKRGLGSVDGRIALMHSIAHIEFNAINLALDALYRFQTLPRAFYQDWLRVAGEEALHFQLVRGYLQDLGADYGDLPAHNGLWLSTYETDHDVLVRMALVPRTLEARGLDVTPAMLQKLRSLKDQAGVDILTILLRDEIGHVAVGTRWFRYLCDQRHLPAFETFIQLIDRYLHGKMRGPFNFEARQAAGFSEEELVWLKEIELGGGTL